MYIFYLSDYLFKTQIVQFILQIKQRELKFSGMGLFYFGYDLIRKVRHIFCKLQINIR